MTMTFYVNENDNLIQNSVTTALPTSPPPAYNSVSATTTFCNYATVNNQQTDFMQPPPPQSSNNQIFYNTATAHLAFKPISEMLPQPPTYTARQFSNTTEETLSPLGSRRAVVICYAVLAQFLVLGIELALNLAQRGYLLSVDPGLSKQIFGDLFSKSTFETQRRFKLSELALDQWGLGLEHLSSVFLITSGLLGVLWRKTRVTSFRRPMLNTIFHSAMFLWSLVVARFVMAIGWSFIGYPIFKDDWNASIDNKDLSKGKSLFIFEWLGQILVREYSVTASALTQSILVCALACPLYNAWGVWLPMVLTVIILAATCLGNVVNYLFIAHFTPWFWPVTPEMFLSTGSSDQDGAKLFAKIIALCSSVGFSWTRLRILPDNPTPNAFFAGGMIVIHKALLETATDEQILGTLAHELGHWHYGHIYWMTLWVSVSMAIVMIPLYFVIRNGSWMMQIFNFEHKVPHFEETRQVIEARKMVPIIPLLLICSYLVTPVGYTSIRGIRLWQHHQELQADAFALKLGHGPGLSSLLKYAGAEHDMVGNNRWWDAVNNVHPSPSTRITILASEK